jgi:hypothetical protein
MVLAQQWEWGQRWSQGEAAEGAKAEAVSWVRTEGEAESGSCSSSSSGCGLPVAMCYIHVLHTCVVVGGCLVGNLRQAYQRVGLVEINCMIRLGGQKNLFLLL